MIFFDTGEIPGLMLSDYYYIILEIRKSPTWNPSGNLEK
jgi:hypothetical protein